MKIIRTRDYQHMSRQAANILSAQVILKPDAVLGLATGSSPLGIYRQLIEWYHKGDIDFSQVHTVNLDEYVGLSPEHEQSYAWFMRHNFFDGAQITPPQTNIPNGLAANEDEECRRYDGVIRSLGGIDLQLLGLGPNGHIGFNEPDRYFSKGTHCVDLTESTIKANSRLFEREEDVPRQAYTMGVQTIMYARMILVIASGEAKADAVRRMCYGPVDPECPASILQLHTNCVVIADEAALSQCPPQ
jgi:glucosamine-6-phosphate deaminase